MFDPDSGFQASPSPPSIDRVSVLHDFRAALVHNRYDELKELLAQGEDPNQLVEYGGGISALALAVLGLNPDIVLLLINRGANPHISDDLNRNVLHVLSLHTISWSDENVLISVQQIIEILLFCEVNPIQHDIQGWTALQYAEKFNPSLHEIMLHTVSGLRRIYLDNLFHTPKPAMTENQTSLFPISSNSNNYANSNTNISSQHQQPQYQHFLQIQPPNSLLGSPLTNGTTVNNNSIINNVHQVAQQNMSSINYRKNSIVTHANSNNHNNNTSGAHPPIDPVMPMPNALETPLSHSIDSSSTTSTNHASTTAGNDFVNYNGLTNSNMMMIHSTPDQRRKPIKSVLGVHKPQLLQQLSHQQPKSQLQQQQQQQLSQVYSFYNNNVPNNGNNNNNNNITNLFPQQSSSNRQSNSAVNNNSVISYQIAAISPTTIQTPPPSFPPLLSHLASKISAFPSLSPLSLPSLQPPPLPSPPSLIPLQNSFLPAYSPDDGASSLCSVVVSPTLAYHIARLPQVLRRAIFDFICPNDETLERISQLAGAVRKRAQGVPPNVSIPAFEVGGGVSGSSAGGMSTPAMTVLGDGSSQLQLRHQNLICLPVSSPHLPSPPFAPPVARQNVPPLIPPSFPTLFQSSRRNPQTPLAPNYSLTEAGGDSSLLNQVSRVSSSSTSFSSQRTNACVTPSPFEIPKPHCALNPWSLYQPNNNITTTSNITNICGINSSNLNNNHNNVHNQNGRNGVNPIPPLFNSNNTNRQAVVNCNPLSVTNYGGNFGDSISTITQQSNASCIVSSLNALNPTTTTILSSSAMNQNNNQHQPHSTLASIHATTNNNNSNSSIPHLPPPLPQNFRSPFHLPTPISNINKKFTMHEENISSPPFPSHYLHSLVSTDSNQQSPHGHTPLSAILSTSFHPMKPGQNTRDSFAIEETPSQSDSVLRGGFRKVFDGSMTEDNLERGSVESRVRDGEGAAFRLLAVSALSNPPFLPPLPTLQNSCLIDDYDTLFS